MSASIRPATDEDGAAVIEIIRTCWSAFPGVIFDIDLEMPELRRFAAHYASIAGRSWVAERDGHVVGCVATSPDVESGAWMLHKLNVLPEARRRGIGMALVREAETAARAQGAVRMVLWSDSRFVASHALYESLGYKRMPETRELHDLSNTVEYGFRRDL